MGRQIGCRSILIVAILLPPVAWLQAPAQQAPPSVEAELLRHGIPLKQLSLQSALKDPRPEVRSLAAAELASRKDGASAPAIIAALGKERVALVAFNMASSLLELDPSVGSKYLARECNDTSRSDDLRLQAASRLVDVQNNSCTSIVESILQNTMDVSRKVSALLILARTQPVTPSFVTRLHPTLVVNLRDPDPAVRGYASRCIAAINDKSAAQDLENAIANERDSKTREQMKGALASMGSHP